jgi:ABC-2 type transport system permease protein
MIGTVILITASLFVDLDIQHPWIMVLFLVMICVTFALFGFIIGIWAENFQQLQLIPLLVITPLVFLGGAFYSISMLPPAWQIVTLFNPVVYLISGFRWAFFGVADVGIGYSLLAVALFFGLCLAVVGLIFKTGYRIKS